MKLVSIKPTIDELQLSAESNVPGCEIVTSQITEGYVLTLIPLVDLYVGKRRGSDAISLLLALKLMGQDPSINLLAYFESDFLQLIQTEPTVFTKLIPYATMIILVYGAAARQVKAWFDDNREALIRASSNLVDEVVATGMQMLSYLQLIYPDLNLGAIPAQKTIDLFIDTRKNIIQPALSLQAKESLVYYLHDLILVKILFPSRLDEILIKRTINENDIWTIINKVTELVALTDNGEAAAYYVDLYLYFAEKFIVNADGLSVYDEYVNNQTSNPAPQLVFNSAQ